jgi:hypothetical protein
MHEDACNNLNSLGPVAPTSTTGQGDNQLPTLDSQTDLPIALTKTTRTSNIWPLLKYYIRYKNNSANFLAYKYRIQSFQCFIVS